MIIRGRFIGDVTCSAGFPLPVTIRKESYSWGADEGSWHQLITEGWNPVKVVAGRKSVVY